MDIFTKLNKIHPKLKYIIALLPLLLFLVFAAYWINDKPFSQFGYFTLNRWFADIPSPPFKKAILKKVTEMPLHQKQGYHILETMSGIIVLYSAFLYDRWGLGQYMARLNWSATVKFIIYLTGGMMIMWWMDIDFFAGKYIYHYKATEWRIATATLLFAIWLMAGIFYLSPFRILIAFYIFSLNFLAVYYTVLFFYDDWVAIKIHGLVYWRYFDIYLLSAWEIFLSHSDDWWSLSRDLRMILLSFPLECAKMVLPVYLARYLYRQFRRYGRISLDLVTDDVIAFIERRKK